MNPISVCGLYWECGKCRKRWDYKIQAEDCCKKVITDGENQVQRATKEQKTRPVQRKRK